MDSGHHKHEHKSSHGARQAAAAQAQGGGAQARTLRHWKALHHLGSLVEGGVQCRRQHRLQARARGRHQGPVGSSKGEAAGGQQEKGVEWEGGVTGSSQSGQHTSCRASAQEGTGCRHVFNEKGELQRRTPALGGGCCRCWCRLQQQLHCRLVASVCCVMEGQAAICGGSQGCFRRRLQQHPQCRLVAFPCWQMEG